MYLFHIPPIYIRFFCIIVCSVLLPPEMNNVLNLSLYFYVVLPGKHSVLTFTKNALGKFFQ